MRNRSRIDIISQILEAANGAGAIRNKIAYKAFLNYNQLKENLMDLTQKDLLRYDEDVQTFKTTEKGLRFLRIYNQIDDMIKVLPQQRRPAQQLQMWIRREKEV